MSRKPVLRVTLTQSNIDTVHRLAQERGYSTTAEMLRAWLKDEVESVGLTWDSSDPVKQWGEHNRKAQEL